MTIKELLETLRNLPEDVMIKEVDVINSGSDRGVYCNFCLGKGNNEVPAKDLIKYIKGNVINKKFIGYKGGTFIMNEDTTITYGYSDCGGYEIDGILIDNEGAKIYSKWY